MTYKPYTDYWVSHAVSEISNTYGDNVSGEAKMKSLLKFGRNQSLGTSSETVWVAGGNETYAATDLITHFSSDDAGDTQTITVEGHTKSGDNLTFVTQSVTLAGQTKTALTTPLARASRVANTGSTDFAGTVYVYEDVSVTGGVPASGIHLQADGSDNQSQKAATSISSSDYYLLTGWYGDVLKKTTASADFTLQVRQAGGVFRPIVTRAASNSTGFYMPFMPFKIVPKNSDIRIVATASTTNVDVLAGFDGALSLVV